MSKSYRQNLIESHRVFMVNIKYFIVALFLSVFIIVPFFYTKLPVWKLSIFVLVLTMWIVGLLEWIFDLPNIYIKKDKSNKLKVRISLFAMYSLILYMFAVGSLHEYYPILKNFVGSNFIINYFNF